MPAIPLKRGVVLRIDGKPYTIAGRHDKDRIAIRADDSDDLIPILPAEIAAGIAEERMQLESPDIHASDDPEALQEKLKMDIEQLPPKRRREFERRRGYITAIDREKPSGFSPKKIMPIVRRHYEEIRDRRAPSFTTVYRWYREYSAATFDIRALIPNFHKQGNSTKRLHTYVQRIIQDAIDVHYLSRTQPRGTDVIDVVRSEVTEKNKLLSPVDQLKMPNAKAIYRFIKRIPPDIKALKREGERVAFLRYHAWLGGVKVTRVLERVEVDHTKLDIFVIDERFGMPIGRPWLTMAIDVYSGLPVGFHLGFDQPSWQSVMACLRHAILPKKKHYEGYEGIENSWDAYGIPDMLVVDNGREFHSEQFELACQHLNIHVLHTKARCPWLKGAIERFFGAMNRQILQSVPGYTFSNTVEKGDYDPKKNAVMDLPTLRERIYMWIIDYYSQRVKRGINDVPARRWAENINKYPIRMPATAADLNVAMYSTETRAVNAYGIDLDNIQYNSEELAEIRRVHGPKVKVNLRYDPNDLGRIHVINPSTGIAFEVPAKDQEYANGLSAWQHRAIRRYWLKHNEAKERQITLAQAKVRMIKAAAVAVADQANKRGKFIAQRFLERMKLELDEDDDPTQTLPDAKEIAPPESKRPVNDPAEEEQRRQRREADRLRRMGTDEDWGDADDD